MSEEKKVSQEEIDAVEKQIKQRQAEELKKISEQQASEIEAKVRKDFEAQKKEEELQKKLEELSKQKEEIQKAMDEKLKAEREAFEKRLEELEGKKKGLSLNQSPFQQNGGEKKNVKIIDGIEVDIDNLDLKAIEEESRKAWMRHAGITDPNWGIPKK